MQHPISERINFLINHYHKGNVASFADKIGISRQAVNRLFHPDLRTNRYPSPSVDVLITILNVFIDIDANWLMKGEGEPFKSNSNRIDIKANSIDKDWKSMYFEILDEKDILTKKYMTLLEKVAKP
ncbi:MULTISPECIES: helix-turn-helix domain-containing protein [Sphingobacterium]|uniref:helix-turn-helix domain-containing protein n=1 Tax=Sphingobacterium TaxID=28453 RepID=UPI002580DA2A|nr:MULTISPECIES: helix-turn-helix transcriptional regulator [Sphingobacterium]